MSGSDGVPSFIRTGQGLAMFVTALLAAGPVWAHAHLQASTPPANATLTASPGLLELVFTEPLEARFSSIGLWDANGKAVALPAVRVAADDPKHCLVDLPELADGQYTVLWRVTAIDTHRSEGRFSFTIHKT